MEEVLRSKVQTVDVKHRQFLAQLRNLVQNKFSLQVEHTLIFTRVILKLVSHLKVITIQQLNTISVTMIKEKIVMGTQRANYLQPY